ncbi:MAG TPA: SpoIIIAH-like family protein [Bacillota bacterium]|jgi:hypothetical protein
MIFDRRALLRFTAFLVVILVCAGYVAIKWNSLKGKATPGNDLKVSAGEGGLSAGGLGLGAAGTGGSGANAANQDFFIDYRLDRDRVRSQQIDQLRELMNNPKADEATRQQAGQRWLKMTDEMGREVELEGLIRSKGFDDAVVVLRDNAAVVIVKVKELTQVEVARIADLVAKVGGVKAENVNIVPKTK